MLWLVGFGCALVCMRVGLLCVFDCWRFVSDVCYLVCVVFVWCVLLALFVVVLFLVGVFL